MVLPAARPLPAATPPLHTLLLGASLALWLCALLGDIAYARSFEIQWLNFAAWLVVGGLVATALALVCALLALMPARRTPGAALHAGLLALAWGVGFFNALMHARDAWASMPGALVLSVLVCALMLAAIWFAWRPLRSGGVS